MRTKLARLLVAAALSLGLTFGVVGPLPAFASTQVTATESVNVRSGPSTTAKIIGGLFRGQTVTAISTASGWTKIKYGNLTAYVSSKYLNTGKDIPDTGKVDAGVVKMTTTSVNLRKGAGLSYGVIKVLSAKAKVTLTGKAARGFTQVVNGGSTGWVSSQYLTSSTTGLPSVIGTRVATADLDIRTSSADNAKTVAEVKKGTKLSVTGATANGRAQIVYKNAVRWVTAKYLSNPDSNLPSLPTLPKVTGSRYATATLDIRSTSADKYTKVAEVARGTKLSITGKITNGRMQIIYNGAARWVTNKYLSTSKPAVAGTGPATAAEKGLKPNAIKVRRAVLARFPQIKTIGGVRPDAIPDHPSGRALDIMIPNYKSASGKALGKEIAAWGKANASSMGINYIIWDQHIWNIQRSGEGWRYMASRGSDSANHKNHVHITVYAAGLPGR